MRIGYFNARGPNNGIEHWFDLEIEELKRRGNEIRTFDTRGNPPSAGDVSWMDIAHFHFAQVANHYKRIGVPYIISPHANDIWCDNGATLISASKHPNCKFVTYQSYYHKRKFEEWGIDKPLVCLPMCVRTKLFKRAHPIECTSGILAGGRLIPKKGLDRIIHLNDLTIFGDGPLKSKLMEMNPNVKFLGQLEGESLHRAYEDAWVFLNPSVVTPDGDSDGIPNTIKEAMLMELQVVSSPVAGIPELENISLLSDWSRLEDVLKDLPREPNIKGRSEILKIYSPEICIDRLLKAIEEYA